MGNTGVTVMWTSRKFLGCHEGGKGGSGRSSRVRGSFSHFPIFDFDFWFFFSIVYSSRFLIMLSRSCLHRQIEEIETFQPVFFVQVVSQLVNSYH